MKEYKIITAAAVLAFAAVMAFGTFLSRGKKSSAEEARSLAEFPKADFQTMYNGDFSKQMNDHFTDHFSLRSKWMSIETKLRSALGESIADGVYIGSERLLDCGFSERVPDPTAERFCIGI